MATDDSDERSDSGVRQRMSIAAGLSWNPANLAEHYGDWVEKLRKLALRG